MQSYSYTKYVKTNNIKLIFDKHYLVKSKWSLKNSGSLGLVGFAMCYKYSWTNEVPTGNVYIWIGQSKAGELTSSKPGNFLFRKELLHENLMWP